ncbi:MAG: metallophosphoesterase family protein, partial [Alphaproteobacteria bacterium]
MHTSLLSILHISDFHFTKRKSRDQQVVIDALIDDLEQLCIGHRRPDLVIFSGDLVNWGGVDSHAGAYDFLLARVAEATGCSDERMFIAPGNHDLSQAAVTASKAEHQEWRAAAGDANAMNSLFDGNAFEEIAQKKFEAYFELERYLSDGSLRHRNQFASVYWIAALNIDIVVLNTAMLSVGGHKEFPPDEGLLAVPEYALLDAARALTQGSYRVYVTHHPFNMLSESAARILRRSIEENAHVHLYGHMHDPESRNSVGFRGQLFSDQAGAVFTQRTQAYIGYSLISVDRTTGYYETHLRTYFDDRKAFDEARDVVTNGKFYSSQEASQFWRKVATPIDDSAFRKHLAGTALDAFTAEMKENESDWEAHELFVPPPMKRTPNQSVAGDGLKS